MTASRRPPLIRYAEALSGILIASAVVRAVPFRRVMRWTRLSREREAADPESIAEIQRTILAAARRVPWRALCFEQGLTAAWMLRRRGFAADVHYGAATIDGELKAHVWVRSAGRDVVGCENSDDYALLARFPDDSPVSNGSRAL
jgi:hypothetical protein